MDKDSNDNGLRVPFGLKNGKLYRPEETDRGLACSCICPGCGSVLISNQGKFRQEYFSHYQSSECAGGYESAIHLMAKQIIDDHKWFVIPEYSKTLSRRMPTDRVLKEHVRAQSKRLDFQVVQVEKTVDGLRPDVIGVTQDGIELFIEVYVTHAVSDDKRERYKNKNLIELDLSALSRGIISDEKLFTEAVLSGADRHWIACQLYRGEVKAAHKSLKAKVKQYISEHRVRVEEVKAFVNDLEQVRRKVQQAAIEKEPKLTAQVTEIQNAEQPEKKQKQYDQRYEVALRSKNQWHRDKQSRIEYLVSVAATLYFRRGLSEVKKCNTCSHFQEISDGDICLECDRSTLRDVRLTPSYIGNLRKMLQQAPLRKWSARP